MNIPFSKWWSHMSVEPAMVFYFFTHVIMEYSNINLYLQKSCHDNATSEADLTNPCDDERRGILFVSNVDSSYKLFMSTTMIFYLMAASRWSDAAGKRRKPLIIIPIIGQIIQLISLCFHAHFWYWPPIAAVLSNMVTQISCGGFLLCLHTCSTYLSDVSSVENRTMRIGILYALEILCLPISSGLAGWLLRTVGYFNTYSLCLITSFVSLYFAVFFIKDISVPVKHPPSIVSALNPMQLVSCFKVLFKSSLGRRKRIIVTLILIHILMWFSFQGQRAVFYLYLRYRFKWDEKVYGYYVAYKTLGSAIGTFFCLVILSKYYKVHDGAIGTFAAFWDTIASLAYMMADKTWQLYVIPLLDVFHGSALAVHYSFFTKFYENHEFGRLTAALNFFSLFIPLCHPIYNYIFQQTMDTYPSAFCGVSMILNVAVCFLYGLAYYWVKKIGMFNY